jgi:signal transduction histidine kinase
MTATLTPPSRSWTPLLIRVALATGLAVLLGMGVAIVALDLPRHEWSLMLQLLGVSAVGSLALGGALLWLSAGRGWNRLGTRLGAIQVIGVLVALINICLAALRMFISSHDLNLLIFLLGYSLAISLIFSWLVGASLVSGIEAVRAGAVRIANGDLSTRVPPAGERELAELAEAVNTMAARLEAAFVRQRELEEARQNLIASVSHDLRTPLASLRVMVEAIADGVARDPATVERYIRAMERETVSLGRLIDDLFEMARLDTTGPALRLSPSPVQRVVAETVDAMAAQAARQQIALSVAAPDDLPPVLIDPDRVQRVVYNLVQNALRHTPADGSVIVEVLDRGPEVQVNVRDTGEGIPPADLPLVFDRFYRGDRARQRDVTGTSTGAGLGLAIARRLVESHGGRIWVAQPPDGGSVFSFTLPKQA